MLELYVMRRKVRKAKAISHLERTTLMEEVSWRPKSRVLRLREGDKCMYFFNRVANSNRKNKYIESLIVSGTVSSNHS